jgi:MinD-like ATPase involved in chromosome partitioning or flagellar assembly
MTEPSHEPRRTDTSDRLYTPEELDAYARAQVPAAAPRPTSAPEPVRGDPLTDPIPTAAPRAPERPSRADLPPGPPPAGPPPAGPPPSAPPPTVAPPSAPPPSATPPPAPPQDPPAGRRVAGAPAAPAAAAAPPAAPPADAGPDVPADVPRFMSATDFLDRRDNDQELGPATWGWRGRVRRWTGGLVQPRMGAREEAFQHDRSAIQRDFDGPRTIAFVNPKGGAAKTTGVLAAGYTFGTVRGGGVVAWDNNETRGTLGIRGTRGSHRNTTRELLEDLGRFKDVYQSRIGDLGAFVRSQGDAHFDVLASDERPDVTGTIRAEDFKEVHSLLERFYRIILVDTGNNMRAENWLAAAEAADLIVVTSTVREDTGYSGLWMLDALQDAGMTDLKHSCVTVLSDPSPRVDERLAADLVSVYEQRTRAVYRVPYDAALVSGSVVPYAELSEDTRRSWLAACAGMAGALEGPHTRK